MIVRRLACVLAIGLFVATSSMGAIGQETAGTDTAARARGIELYRQGKFSEAAKHLETAVKVNKADDEAWHYLGLVLLTQPKKIKDATKAFEAATKLRPEFAGAHAGLALTYLRRNRLSEAVREAKAALSINPSIAEAHYIIAVARMNSGDSEEGLSEAREVIRLNPEFSAAYLLKSQALVRVYAKKSMEALERLRFMTPSSSPATPEERAERHQRRLEDTALLKEAADSLDTYLRLDPSSSVADHLREQLVSLKFWGSYTGDKTNLDDAPYASGDVTTKARVIAKPEPRYTESAREAQVTGTVALRAVFGSDGNVRHILVLTGLPNGLTEASIRAARQIKFIPAMIDGRTVSMFVQIEYNFNLY